MEHLALPGKSPMIFLQSIVGLEIATPEKPHRKDMIDMADDGLMHWSRGNRYVPDEFKTLRRVFEGPGGALVQAPTVRYIKSRDIKAIGTKYISFQPNLSLPGGLA
ncbi:MAG: hypothetical protein R3C05_25475 [Pirellulaceae bacterium]